MKIKKTLSFLLIFSMMASLIVSVPAQVSAATAQGQQCQNLTNLIEANSTSVYNETFDNYTSIKDVAWSSATLPGSWTVESTTVEESFREYYVSQNPDGVSGDLSFRINSTGRQSKTRTVTNTIGGDYIHQPYILVGTKLKYQSLADTKITINTDHHQLSNGDFNPTANVHLANRSFINVYLNTRTGYDYILSDKVRTSSGTTEYDFTSNGGSKPSSFFDKWVDVWFVIDTKAQNFNLYVDGIKQSEEFINGNIGYIGDNRYITRINSISFQNNKYSTLKGDTYIDDIQVRYMTAQQVANFELAKLDAPDTVSTGTVLPSAANDGILGSTIAWSCSDNTVTVENGIVTVVDKSKDFATLTATVNYGGATGTKDFKVKIIDEDEANRMKDIENNLTGYVLSSQKYVTQDFTASIPGIQNDDEVTLVSSDTNTISFNGLNATVTAGSSDKYVDVTVNIKSAKGATISKVLKLYVLSQSSILFYDGFDYPQNIGSSVNGNGLWTVSNENTDISLTGSTHIMKYSPDDKTDQMVDVQVYRKYSVGNQLATYTDQIDVLPETIMQMNMKFTDDAKNRYVVYVSGTYQDQKGTNTYSAVSQFYIERGSGKICCERVKDSNGEYINLMPGGSLPTNEWFNFKVDYDNVNRCLDLYINNVKQNTSPIPYYRNIDGEKLISIEYVAIGVGRSWGNPGHLYIDDFMLREEQSLVAIHEEYDNLTIPSTFVNDVELPVTGLYKETEISWDSSDETVVSNDGKVNRKLGFGSTYVTLTATLKFGEKTLTKDFDVKVVDSPYYTIDSILFKTLAGEDSYVPTANGTIEKISITKHTTATDDNAVAYVGVFDSTGALIKMAKPKAVNSSGDISIGLELPNMENIYVTAFVWNSKTSQVLADSYSVTFD